MIARMKELSAQYPRYGYRRIRIFLGRDGHRMSAGRALSAVAGCAGCRCRASGRGKRIAARSAAAASAARAEPGVVLRLRVRSLRQRPAAGGPCVSTVSIVCGPTGHLQGWARARLTAVVAKRDVPDLRAVV